jgi:hypothetical protein
MSKFKQDFIKSSILLGFPLLLATRMNLVKGHILLLLFRPYLHLL